MKYRKLGKSEIKVSEIGFGAWVIGLDWWGKKIDDDEAIRMLKRAYDVGINFYETADMYGKGKSEKLIAQTFKGMRNEVIYSTKWGYDLYNAKKYDVGIMVRVPDASGVLTGKINEKTIFDKNDHRANRKKEWITEAMKKIEKMTPFLNTKGWDIYQLAIKFILSQKQVSVVLPTVTDIEEIETIADMSDGNYLTEDELAYMTELYNNNFYVESVIS